MGYTVVFYTHNEIGTLEFRRQTFVKRETAQAWVKLIKINGFELHSIVREAVSEGARV